MLSNHSVHFFPGQRLTPDALNAIEGGAARRQQLFSQLFVGSEGVVDGFAGTLQVSLVPETALTLRIDSGAAINRNGEILLLEEATLINLKGITLSEDALYILEIVGDGLFQDATQDSDLKVIKGFQSKRLVPRLQLTINPSTEGVELARVRLSKSTSELKLISDSTDIQIPTQSQTGVVDTRFVRRLQVNFREMLAFQDLHLVRKTLADMHACLAQIESVYPGLQRFRDVRQLTLTLRGEVADPAFSKYRVTFMLNELSRGLLDLFEDLRDLLAQRENRAAASFWPSVFELGESIHATSHKFDLNTFKLMGNLLHVLREKLLQTSVEKERVTLIREAIQTLRNGQFLAHAEHVFGGSLFHLFTRFDHQSLKDKSQTEVLFDTQKTLTSHYADGSGFCGTGRFYSEGRLTIPLEGIKNPSELVVIMQVYKRRGAKDFALSLNGYAVHQELLSAAESVDTVLNIGAYIPKEWVRPGTNQLVIDIRRVDLDFGLMSLAVYSGLTTAGGI